MSDAIEKLQKHLEDMRNICILCKADKRSPNWVPCDACKPPPNYPPVAPEGQVFLCRACGKLSETIYPPDAYSAWDESCMFNAVLVYLASIELDQRGNIIKVQAVEGY